MEDGGPVGWVLFTRLSQPPLTRPARYYAKPFGLYQSTTHIFRSVRRRRHHFRGAYIASGTPRRTNRATAKIDYDRQTSALLAVNSAAVTSRLSVIVD